MKSVLIVRSLPGIADLEVDLLMRRNEYDGIEEDLAWSVARKLFGLVWDDVYRVWDQHGDSLITRFELADDETMNSMLQLGVDFSDDRGNPLRCTNLLAAFAEIAARGLAGHLPDPEAAALDQAAASLARERDAFIASKRRGGR